MKKVFICLNSLLIVLCFSAEAQIQRGNALIGADLANVNLSLDAGGNFSFLIRPKIAWFIKDNVAIGGYLLTGLSTAKGEGTSVQYGVGALARYYLGGESVDLIKHTRLFAEGTVGINGDNPAVGDNTNGLGLGIGPGIAYFITPNIGLEALLKYNGIIGFGTKPTSNDLNISVGFQIYLSSARARTIRDEIKSETK
ncbi:outer membrane beta-barrel protein [Flavitalea sp.]|nr:outer membrane beta-barrel protein [Flavitalea sp.]